MKTPEEFKELCQWFYQGSRDEFVGHEEWIAHAVASVHGEKRVIKEFLDELLSGRYSDDEIAQVWNSTHADYDFSRGSHRVFLTQIRRALG